MNFRSPTRHGCLYSSKLPRSPIRLFRKAFQVPEATSRTCTGSSRPLLHFDWYSSFKSSKIHLHTAGQFISAAAVGSRLDQQHVSRMAVHVWCEREHIIGKLKLGEARFHGPNHLILAKFFAS